MLLRLFNTLWEPWTTKKKKNTVRHHWYGPNEIRAISSPLLDPTSTVRLHKTCTGVLPQAGPWLPQSCSYWVRGNVIIQQSHSILSHEQAARFTYNLLLRGILVDQLLKEPDTKTSLALPVQRNTVGLASVGHLLSLSRSCCQARNSCSSCGTWKQGCFHFNEDMNEGLAPFHQREACRLNKAVVASLGFEDLDLGQMDVGWQLQDLLQVKRFLEICQFESWALPLYIWARHWNLMVWSKWIN